MPETKKKVKKPRTKKPNKPVNKPEIVEEGQVKIEPLEPIWEDW